MKEQQNLKQKVIRYIVYFLGGILACTIISKSIYDHLLPVVSATKVTSGQVEVKHTATGKIGLDETRLKHEKAMITSSIAGKVMALQKVEGDYVKQGEVIGIIQKHTDAKVRHEEEVEQIQLTQEMEQLTRESEQKHEKIKTLEKKYKEKEAELTNIESDYKVVSIKDEISQQEKLIQNNKELYELGAISKEEMEKAQLKLNALNRSLEENRRELKKNLEDSIMSYKEEIEQAEDELLKLEDQYQLNVKKSKGVGVQEEKLVSPISGYIQTINAYQGAYVEANSQLVVIIPEGIEYRLSFELPEIAASKVSAGQEVSFSYTQIPYKARMIKKRFNEETGNIQIDCELTQEILDKMNLEYNSYRTVNVQVSKLSEEYPMVISNRALQKENQTYFVYVIEEEKQLGRTSYILRKTQVNLLEEGDFKSAISGNVSSEMKMVEGDLSQLVDGQEVTLQ